LSPQITGLDCPCPGREASHATFSVGDHVNGIDAGSISDAPAPRNPGQAGVSTAMRIVRRNDRVNIVNSERSGPAFKINARTDFSQSAEAWWK